MLLSKELNGERIKRYALILDVKIKQKSGEYAIDTEQNDAAERDVGILRNKEDCAERTCAKYGVNVQDLKARR